MNNPDLVKPDTIVGMLRKAGRIVERAAKHPDYGSQTLWDISAQIKEEASRIAYEHGTTEGQGLDPSGGAE